MASPLATLPRPDKWRASLLPAALACLVPLLLASGSATAQDGTAPTLRDHLTRITWTEGKGLTRVHFHASGPFLPDLVRTAPTVLRLDFRDVGGGATPGRLQVGSTQIQSVSRLPDAVRHYLPEEVSERFLVNMTRADLGWSTQRVDDGFILFVGDKERVGRRTTVLPALTVIDSSEGTEGTKDVRVRRGERLRPPQPFTAGAQLVVRRGPSGVSPVVGEVAEGEACVADGRRGGWLHLERGGWVRYSLGGSPPAVSKTARRTPHSWSVVTLGSGLSITLDELAAGEDEASRVTALFASPWRVARLTILATASTSYGYRFPPKEGRAVFEMNDGTEVLSPNPLTLARARGVSKEDVANVFVTPEILPGDGWTGWIVLPLSFQFGEVKNARIDAAGRPHLLFHVPGSGEIVGE